MQAYNRNMSEVQQRAFAEIAMQHMGLEGKRILGEQKQRSDRLHNLLQQENLSLAEERNKNVAQEELTADLMQTIPDQDSIPITEFVVEEHLMVVKSKFDAQTKRLEMECKCLHEHVHFSNEAESWMARECSAQTKKSTTLEEQLLETDNDRIQIHDLEEKLCEELAVSEFNASIAEIASEQRLEQLEETNI